MRTLARGRRENATGREDPLRAGLHPAGSGPATPGLGKDRADELIQPGAVGSDGFGDLTLFATECRADVSETSLDPAVNSQGATQQRADARIDLSIQLTGIGASDLNASELSWASRGHVFAP